MATASSFRSSADRRLALDRAIDAGVAFLAGRQEAGGQWRDFDLPTKGLSDALVTGIAGWCLADDPWLRARARPLLDRAADFLIARARADGTWGYNEEAFADCGSTSWAWRCLQRLGRRPRLGSPSVLLGFRQKDGGFSAYRPGDEPNSWGTITHPEDTPLVLSCLLEWSELEPKVLREGLGSILRHRTVAGWPTYWWGGSPLFSTWLNLEFLSKLGQSDAAEGLDIECSAREPLSRAFLALCEPHRGRRAALIADRLLGEQERDGGWPCAPLMTYPSRDYYEPAGSMQQWAYPDFRRVVTTATTLLALARSRREAEEAR
jgi:hypothetical protein